MLGWTHERNFTFVVCCLSDYTVNNKIFRLHSDSKMIRDGLSRAYEKSEKSIFQKLIYLWNWIYERWIDMQIPKELIIIIFPTVQIYEMREIYPAFEWNFPFLACTHLIILNLHEHDNEFKSHAVLSRSSCCCCGWWWFFFMRAHGLASSKVHRTERSNVIKSCF